MTRPSVLLAAALLALGALLPTPARAATSTTVSLAFSEATVKLAAPATVSGSVSGATGRPVRLEVKLASGWRTLRTATTSSTRRYSFPAPTNWLHKHYLRVVAPATGSYTTGVSSARTLTVVPTWTPAGTSTDWRWLHTARPRFDPCRAITWRFNQNGGYATSLTDLKRAFHNLAQATGLTFTYLGTTTRVPLRDADDPTATLTVGFATPTLVSTLAGLVAGQGGPSWTLHDGIAEATHGRLVLDSTAKLPAGFSTSGGATWGQIMQHELAHALGLGHASGSSQVLYGAATSANHRLGAGDLSGLRSVGLQAGCIPNAVRKV